MYKKLFFLMLFVTSCVQADSWQPLPHAELDEQICDLKIHVAQEALSIWLKEGSLQPLLQEINEDMDVLAQHYPELHNDLNLYASLTGEFQSLPYILYEDENTSQHLTRKYFLNQTSDEKEKYWASRRKYCLNIIQTSHSLYPNGN